MSIKEIVMGAAGATAPGSPPDAKFNQVTMLLHGDGTNGKQNNTFLDSSSNNFTITRNGNTTQGSFSPYGSNWSNYFNGSTYFETTSSQIVPTGSFTVECLVYVAGTNSQAFVAQGTSGNSARFSIAIDGGLWWAQIGNNTINAGTPTANTWNYLAATFNGSTLTLYVNGTSVGSVATTTSAQNTTLAIGNYGTSWVTSGYYTTGYISNVRISNVVRTITTPTAPYTSDANTNALFCQSNRFIDASANNYAISIATGTPSVQRFSPFAPSTAYSTSVIGGSGYLDGSGDSLIIGNPSVNSAVDFGSGDFTIEAWVYPNGTSTYLVAGSLDNSNGNGCWWLMVNGTFSGGGTIQFGYNITAGGSGINVLRGTGTLSVGAWSHVAVTRNGSNIRAYLNGVQLGSTYTGIGSDAIYPVNQNIYVGSSVDGAYQLNGYISDVRLLKGTALYTGSTYTIPTAPLTAITNTSRLLNFTNGAIYDNAMMNDLETVGNAQISTSVVKYGTGSLKFDGTGDYLSTPASPNLSFGSGDFTIECWVYANSLGSYNAVFAQWPDNGGTTNNSFTLESVGSSMDFYCASGTSLYGPATLGTITTGVWIHYAICRSGNTLYPFKNGVLGTTLSLSQTLNTSTYPVTVGGQVAGAGYWDGYIDDLRITKGYARYTANFTPPTAALSDN